MFLTPAALMDTDKINLPQFQDAPTRLGPSFLEAIKKIHHRHQPTNFVFPSID
jgi:hypothetical protein